MFRPYYYHLEIRKVTEQDIDTFNCFNEIEVCVGDEKIIVFIEKHDIDNGSPKLGDVIARNISNHKKQWLITKEQITNKGEQNDSKD